MDLLNSLRNMVPNQIFKRGHRYYKNGHVVDYDISKKDRYGVIIDAMVEGTRSYLIRIELSFNQGRIELQGKCNCPYWGEMCKHQVAVLHEFFINDFNDIKNKIEGDKKFNQLLGLLEETKVKKEPQLTYKIKGLESKNMVNFKLTVESEELNDMELDELVSSLQSSSFYSYRYQIVQDSLAIKDQINLSYFKGVETSRSSSTGALLFSKTRENFNYILNLIKNNEVYIEENNQRAEVGEVLSPELIIDGDENKIMILEKDSYQVYKGQGVSWVVLDNNVHSFEDYLGFNLPISMEIPKEERGRFLFEIIPMLEEKFSAKITKNLEGYKLYKKRPEIKVDLDYIGDIIKCKVKVTVGEDEYKNSEILGFDISNRHYQEHQEEEKNWSALATEDIEEILRYLEEYNFHVKPKFFYINDHNHIQEFISRGIAKLPEHWELTTSEDFEQIEVVELELQPVIEFEENDGGINWFEFKVTYNLAGQSYSREELKRLLKKNKDGESYLHLDNKYFILKESMQEENLNKIIDNAERQDDGSYRSNYYNLLYYQNLVRDAGINFTGNRVYNQLNQDITEDNLVQVEEVPIEVGDVLRSYQESGYSWMKFLYKYHFGGILADDMGLGKTLQTLTLLKSLESDKPSLIICPRTLIYNWSAEIDKFFPDTKYLVYYGTPKERKEMRADLDEYEMIITSYDIVSRDYEKLEKRLFVYCILDEAHNIKNRTAQRTKGVKGIKSEYKLALTGTPLENSLEELWSIFDFLMPGYLNNYSQFRKKYLNPIIKDNEVGKLNELKRRIAPFLLRRKKETVLDDLPEKMINIYPVEMNKVQADTYKLILEELKKELTETVVDRGFNRSRINILAALTKLRQVCNHPNLVLDKGDIKNSSGKIDALLELVEEAILAGHKLIVFSQFVSMLKIIRERFVEKGIEFEYLDGSTKNRMERVERFNGSEDIKVFLISLKAGGVGLNLTSADIVVHVDPWWNPMVERQATDRAHRIGQKNKVIVYKLITKGTVEEKMLKLQEKKQDIFESIIEDNTSPMDNITWDDIQELLEY